MRFSPLDVPAVRSYLDKRLLCSVDTSEKRVALTFDDGPHPRHTPRLLDLLAEKNARATFFLVGKRVRQFPEVTRMIVEGGHEIGNHTYRHLPLSLLPSPMVRNEIREAGDLIMHASGFRPRYLRPPMGWFNGNVLRIAAELGYRPVIGDVHPRDSRTPGTEIILQYILERVKPGSIVILHDGGWRLDADRSQSIEATRRFLAEMTDRGYAFETLTGLVAASTPAGPG